MWTASAIRTSKIALAVWKRRECNVHTHTQNRSRWLNANAKVKEIHTATTFTSCICLCLSSLFNFIWSCLVLMIGVLFHSCEFEHMQQHRHIFVLLMHVKIAKHRLPIDKRTETFLSIWVCRWFECITKSRRIVHFDYFYVTKSANRRFDIPIQSMQNGYMYTINSHALISIYFNLFCICI